MKSSFTGRVVLSGICILFVGGWVSGEDADLAQAFAVSAAQLNSLGKTENARNMCFKALANDPNCPAALMELGKIYQNEGRTVEAGNFYARVVSILDKKSGRDAEQNGMLKSAERLTRETNPYALQLKSTLGAYAKEIHAATKQYPDSITENAVRERATKLNLANFVAADEMPDFGQAKTKEPETKRPDNEKGDTGRPFGGRQAKTPEPKKTEPVTNLSAEIERTLKKSGWTAITGKWTKVGTNIYEVEDATLAADKTNGQLGLYVHKIGTGTVCAYVRAKKQSRSYYYDTIPDGAYSGFGYVIRSSTASVYIPSESYSSSGDAYEPYKEMDRALPANFIKNYFLLTADGTKLDYHLNGNKIRSFKYPIQENGQFIIEIKGKRTIEMPVASGQ